MSRNLHRAVVMAVLTGLTSCMDGSRPVELSEPSDVASQFIPPDAQDRQTAPDIPWTQISFRVLRRPLEYAFDEQQLSARTRQGWWVCGPRSTQWPGYDDRSVTPARYVQSRTWVLYKDGWQVILSGLYFSASEAESITASSDDATRVEQQGVISARPTDLTQARQMAESFDLDCAEPAPQ